jgi:DNA polymerase III epsilon subunit-like protein
MPLTILLLDTETNGLPKNRFAPASEFDAYPAILQLSWAIYTVEGSILKFVKTRDIGVRLDSSIPWDTGAAKIHGLTEMEARHGTHATDALLELGNALRTVDVVVAHNLAFDKPVIRAAGYAEASRSSTPTNAHILRTLWPPALKEFCTMKETKALVRLPPSEAQAKYADLGPFKAPKLNELYAWLYGHVYDISGASLHSARSDVHCLSQCIAGLLRKGFLTVENTNLLLTAAPATDTE